MAWGSSDDAFEDARNLHKLDDMVSEAKHLLSLCREFISHDNKDQLTKKLMLEAIDNFIAKKA